MRYADYDKKIFSNFDIHGYQNSFEKELKDKQKEIDAFVERAGKRVKWINACEVNKKYCILGSLYRNGKNKDILLIIRYEDGSQRDERYSYKTIAEARNKLAELKEKYSDVDWSQFNEGI